MANLVGTCNPARSGLRRRGLVFSFTLSLLGLALLAPPARATLVMEMQARARVRGPDLVVRLSLHNRGDEAAQELQAEVLHPAGARPGRLVESLAPGGKVAWRLRLPAPEGRGRAAVILRVRYRDGNRYPFSALSWAYYHRGRDRPGILALSSPTLELAQETRAGLEIKNLGQQPLKLRARVFTPQELGAEPARQELELPARGREELAFELANLSGLTGSSYPVLVLLSYRLGQENMAQVASLMVKLVPGEAGFFRRYRGWLAGLLVLFLLLFVWSQVLARRRRNA